MSLRPVLSSRLLSRSIIPKATLIPRLACYSTRLSSLPHLASRTTTVPRPSVLSAQTSFQSIRFASSGSLSKDDIQRRILEVLGSFEKCDPAKITPTASFTSDLGLDSLDAVEVVMAIEEEFSIEIPDEEADKITTVSEAISYIERTPEAI